MIFLWIFLLLTPAMAQTSVYYFGADAVAFERVDGFLVNRGCLKKECLALKNGRQYKDHSPSPQELSGGKNPAAVKCKTVMSGTVVIGTDGEGHQQSFCVFSDQSYLR